MGQSLATQLFTSVSAGEVDRVTEAIDSGLIDSNATDSDGTTLLHLACHNRRANVVKVLLERGASGQLPAGDLRTCALHHAAMQGADDCMLEFLKYQRKNPNSNNQFAATMVDKHGNSPLHYAVAAGNLRSVALILQLDGELDRTNSEGRTALDVAMSKGQTDILLFFAVACRIDLKGKLYTLASTGTISDPHVQGVRASSVLAGLPQVFHAQFEKGIDLVLSNLWLQDLPETLEVSKTLLLHSIMKSGFSARSLSSSMESLVSFRHSMTLMSPLHSIVSSSAQTTSQHANRLEMFEVLALDCLLSTTASHLQQDPHSLPHTAHFHQSRQIGSELNLPSNDFLDFLEQRHEKNQCCVILKTACNAQDRQGRTPFSIVCAGSDTELAKMMMLCGADCSILADDGSSPFFRALSNGLSFPIQKMLSTEAGIMSMLSNTSENRNVLHIAATSRRPLEMIEIVADHLSKLWLMIPLSFQHLESSERDLLTGLAFLRQPLCKQSAAESSKLLELLSRCHPLMEHVTVYQLQSSTTSLQNSQGSHPNHQAKLTQNICKLQNGNTDMHPKFIKNAQWNKCCDELGSKGLLLDGSEQQEIEDGDIRGFVPALVIALQATELKMSLQPTDLLQQLEQSIYSRCLRTFLRHLKTLSIVSESIGNRNISIGDCRTSDRGTAARNLENVNLAEIIQFDLDVDYDEIDQDKSKTEILLKDTIGSSMVPFEETESKNLALTLKEEISDMPMIDHHEKNEATVQVAAIFPEESLPSERRDSPTNVDTQLTNSVSPSTFRAESPSPTPRMSHFQVAQREHILHKMRAGDNTDGQTTSQLDSEGRILARQALIAQEEHDALTHKSVSPKDNQICDEQNEMNTPDDHSLLSLAKWKSPTESQEHRDVIVLNHSKLPASQPVGSENESNEEKEATPRFSTLRDFNMQFVARASSSSASSSQWFNNFKKHRLLARQGVSRQRPVSAKPLAVTRHALSKEARLPKPSALPDNEFAPLHTSLRHKVLSNDDAVSNPFSESSDASQRPSHESSNFNNDDQTDQEVLTGESKEKDELRLPAFDPHNENTRQVINTVQVAQDSVKSYSAYRAVEMIHESFSAYLCRRRMKAFKKLSSVTCDACDLQLGGPAAHFMIDEATSKNWTVDGTKNQELLIVLLSKYAERLNLEGDARFRQNNGLTDVRNCYTASLAAIIAARVHPFGNLVQAAPNTNNHVTTVLRSAQNVDKGLFGQVSGACDDSKYTGMEQLLKSFVTRDHVFLKKPSLEIKESKAVQEFTPCLVHPHCLQTMFAQFERASWDGIRRRWSELSVAQERRSTNVFAKTLQRFWVHVMSRKYFSNREARQVSNQIFNHRYCQSEHLLNHNATKLQSIYRKHLSSRILAELQKSRADQLAISALVLNVIVLQSNIRSKIARNCVFSSRMIEIDRRQADASGLISLAWRRSRSCKIFKRKLQEKRSRMASTIACNIKCKLARLEFRRRCYLNSLSDKGLNARTIQRVWRGHMKRILFKKMSISVLFKACKAAEAVLRPYFIRFVIQKRDIKRRLQLELDWETNRYRSDVAANRIICVFKKMIAKKRMKAGLLLGFSRLFAAKATLIQNAVRAHQSRSLVAKQRMFWLLASQRRRTSGAPQNKHARLLKPPLHMDQNSMSTFLSEEDRNVWRIDPPPASFWRSCPLAMSSFDLEHTQNIRIKYRNHMSRLQQGTLSRIEKKDIPLYEENLAACLLNSYKNDVASMSDDLKHLRIVSLCKTTRIDFRESNFPWSLAMVKDQEQLQTTSSSSNISNNPRSQLMLPPLPLRSHKQRMLFAAEAKANHLLHSVLYGRDLTNSARPKNFDSDNFKYNKDSFSSNHQVQASISYWHHASAAKLRRLAGELWIDIESVCSLSWSHLFARFKHRRITKAAIMRSSKKRSDRLIVNLQTAWRRKLAATHFLALKKKETLKQSSQRNFFHRQAAATLLARIWRRHHAVNIWQRAVDGRNYSAQTRSAAVLQQNYRCHFSRRILRYAIKLRIKRASAIIVNFCKLPWARRLRVALFNLARKRLTTNCAVLLQTSWRAHRAKCQMLEKIELRKRAIRETQTQAATKIQRMERGRVRKQKISYLAKRRDGAIRVSEMVTTLDTLQTHWLSGYTCIKQHSLSSFIAIASRNQQFERAFDTDDWVGCASYLLSAIHHIIRKSKPAANETQTEISNDISPVVDNHSLPITPIILNSEVPVENGRLTIKTPRDLHAKPLRGSDSVIGESNVSESSSFSQQVWTVHPEFQKVISQPLPSTNEMTLNGDAFSQNMMKHAKALPSCPGTESFATSMCLWLGIDLKKQDSDLINDSNLASILMSRPYLGMLSNTCSFLCEFGGRLLHRFESDLSIPAGTGRPARNSLYLTQALQLLLSCKQLLDGAGRAIDFDNGHGNSVQVKSPDGVQLLTWLGRHQLKTFLFDLLAKAAHLVSDHARSVEYSLVAIRSEQLDPNPAIRPALLLHMAVGLIHLRKLGEAKESLSMTLQELTQLNPTVKDYLLGEDISGTHPAESRSSKTRLIGNWSGPGTLLWPGQDSPFQEGVLMTGMSTLINQAVLQLHLLKPHRASKNLRAAAALLSQQKQNMMSSEEPLLIIRHIKEAIKAVKLSADRNSTREQRKASRQPKVQKEKSRFGNKISMAEQLSLKPETRTMRDKPFESGDDRAHSTSVRNSSEAVNREFTTLRVYIQNEFAELDSYEEFDSDATPREAANPLSFDSSKREMSGNIVQVSDHLNTNSDEQMFHGHQQIGPAFSEQERMPWEGRKHTELLSARERAKAFLQHLEKAQDNTADFDSDELSGQSSHHTSFEESFSVGEQSEDLESWSSISKEDIHSTSDQEAMSTEH